MKKPQTASKRIAFFETEKREEKAIKKTFGQKNLYLCGDKVADCADQEAFLAEIISTFIYSKLDAKTLKKFKNLRMIATRSTGFDHIDLDYCRQKKITVANVPHYGENTVAEHTFALILALTRKIVPSVEQTRLGDFRTENLTGLDLKGKIIGVLGTGSIGCHVVRIAHGFEMKIIAFDANPSEDLVNHYGVRFLPLKDVLVKADILTIHLPATKETKHIINNRNINQIKKGAIIINTARGNLIETSALILGLSKETPAAAGLDVFEEEGDIKEESELISKNCPKDRLMVNVANNILLHHPKVIATPHNAFNSTEALERILSTSIENILAFEKGRVKNSVLSLGRAL